ncbi:hypothetical protein [Streptosporangium sp. NPDC049078]|uniref:hypothetical protein n=1 Tax=Streptosporangium sp. NPDC049078 TaxID=3155767 RepID=UPI003449C5F8
MAAAVDPVDVGVPVRPHQLSDHHHLRRLPMNGPDHYREGERLAEQAERLFEEFVAAHDEDGDTPGVHLIRRQAKHCQEMGVLHATLALAAATALNDAINDSGDGGLPREDWVAWKAAAGTPKDGAS